MMSPRAALIAACLTCVVPAAWTWADVPADEQRPSVDAAQCATLREFSDAPSPYRDAWHDYQCYERLGLRYGPRKSVEHKAPPRIGFPDAISDDRDYDVVRHEFATFHRTLCAEPDGRTGRNRSTQHVARRKLNNSVFG